MRRPKKFACLICGKRFNLKNRVLLHIFNNHLRPALVVVDLQYCWCQGEFSLTAALGFRGWREHLRSAGGLQTHYATHALDIGG
jgi:hypothetical protein